jgi:hypothetical protein
VPAAEARQVIQAQSADFGAYRQKLAAGVPTAPAAEAPAGTASGKVEAEVQDRKQAAPSTDKLTLSRGGVAAGKAGAEEQLAKSRAQQENSARVAELAKNVDDLKKLQGAAAAGGGSALRPGPGPLAVPGTPAPQPHEPPAAAQGTELHRPWRHRHRPRRLRWPQPPSPLRPRRRSWPPPRRRPRRRPPRARHRPARSRSRPPRSRAARQHARSPAAGARRRALVVLLAGLGLYRMRRNRQESGETSFLESRLQPDSFFGASGGQRVDTRDATGVPSSMSYSLSQLDAIGDVDPVAEADVYLAYGRDLQAEEILKEAMRANPERMAIRMKLLEVYAKRRDTKGFELLAAQLHALTGGEGEDWAAPSSSAWHRPRQTRCTSPAATRRCGDRHGRGRRAAGREHDAAVGAAVALALRGAALRDGAVDGRPRPRRLRADGLDTTPVLPTERTQPMVAAAGPGGAEAGRCRPGVRPADARLDCADRAAAGPGSARPSRWRRRRSRACRTSAASTCPAWPMPTKACRASWSWPRNSARSATWKARATSCRRSSPSPRRRRAEVARTRPC